MADKGKLTQINEALDWIARTNQTLEQVQGDTLLTMQYERLRQQFMDQLANLLTTNTQSLTVVPKPNKRAA